MQATKPTTAKEDTRIPVADIQAMVDYVYYDEERNYGDMCLPENKSTRAEREGHIFRHIKRVARWLDSVSANSAA